MVSPKFDKIYTAFMLIALLFQLLTVPWAIYCIYELLGVLGDKWPIGLVISLFTVMLAVVVGSWTIFIINFRKAHAKRTKPATKSHFGGLPWNRLEDFPETPAGTADYLLGCFANWYPKDADERSSDFEDIRAALLWAIERHTDSKTPSNAGLL